MKSHYQKLAGFNVWANKKMADFISSRLDESMTDREIISSFASVRKTIYHLWDAETVWLERLKGSSKGPLPSTTFKGKLNEGIQMFLQNSSDFDKFLSQQEENYFSKDVTYTHANGSMLTEPIQDVLTHVFQHGSYHRGQLVTMFRQLGFTEGIPRTDYIAYYRERVVGGVHA